MNNDVAGKMNNKFDAQKKFAPNSIEKQAAQKTTNPIVNQKLENNVKTGRTTLNLFGLRFNFINKKLVKRNCNQCFF